MIRYDPPGVRVYGKRWEFDLTIVDAAGVPKDLTGATVTFALGGGVSLRFLSKLATLSDQGSHPGQATVVVLPTETGMIPLVGQLFYQVDVAYDAANLDTVAYGYFYVQRSLI